MRRQILKGSGVVLCCTFMFVLVPGAILGGRAHAESVMPDEWSGLQNRLQENLKEEAWLREKMRSALDVASRPNASYLLHQKSLGLQNDRDRLHALQAEKAELIRAIEGLTARDLASEALLRRARQGFSMQNMRKDSGSPALSFQQASLVHVANTSTEKRALYRAMMAGFLLIVLSFPLIAFFKKDTPFPVRKRVIRVFPMFTVRNEAYGSRELLKIQVDRQGKLLSHLSG